MNHNESRIISQALDREITKSRKWIEVSSPDVLGMGIADMDFRTPAQVIDALKSRVDHGIFGYDQVPNDLIETIAERLNKLYDWRIEPEWISLMPGIIPSLNAANRTLGNVGDDVITLTPTYSEIVNSARRSDRNVIKVGLVNINNKWEIDFDRLEQSITARTTTVNLCNPHNPIGRSYTTEELTKIVDICNRYEIFISSDEVYSDLILDENKKHISIASMDERIAQNSITHLSASKTFNLSGLRFSYAIIPNRKIHEKFIQHTFGILPGVNFLGAIATLSAYQYGEEWRQELLDYLRANRAMVYDYINNTPGLSVSEIEATFLALIDIKSLKLDDPVSFFSTHAKVQILDGSEFSAPGYIRLNFGCDTDKLESALNRIIRAINSYKSCK